MPLAVRHYGESALPVEKELDKAQKITAAARIRLVEVPHLTAQRIWCECQGSQLVLRGQVPSFYFKQLAQEAVAGMEGVSQVVNDIEVIW
jgi:osmotically-inducible protein OsmY